MSTGQSHSWSPQEASAAATIRGELRRLHAIDPSSAQLLESLAFVLTRVASADNDICEAETFEMEEVLMRLAELPPAQAMLAVEIAKQRTKLVGPCSYSVSRCLREQTDPVHRLELLRSLVAVAGADGELCELEAEAISRIALELGFTRDIVCELLAESASYDA